MFRINTENQNIGCLTLFGKNEIKKKGQKQQQQQWIKKTKEVTEKITKYGLKFNDSYRFMQSSI